MTTTVLAEIAGISGGCALAAGVVLWVLTTPLRRRSLRSALLVLGVLCLASTLAAVIGTARAMFLSPHDLDVTVVVAVVVAVVVTGAALLLSRMIAREHGSLREAAQHLGTGRDPETIRHRRLASEPEQVRRSLIEAGRALAESRDRERALVVSQRDTFAAMSHDLRTPLAGIRAMAEALEDGVASDPAVYHARIRAEMDRVVDMVNALFDLARPRGLSADPAPVAFSLSDIVSDCLAGLDALARSRGITLSGRADHMVDLTGDPAGVSRAVDNVITNALAATPPGGAVEVVLDRSTGSPSSALLTITDTCGGIGGADLARVFDIGFRGSRPADLARTAPGGAGLGLAVTRAVVEAHRGTVTVANTASGCVFTVELPLP